MGDGGLITNLRFLTNKALDMMKFESAKLLKSKGENALGPDRAGRRASNVSCGLQARSGRWVVVTRSQP